MNFNDEPCQQSQENDNFPIQFLSMPELDAEPPETKPGVELLAEFDIDHDVDEGIVRKAAGKQNEHISLNCVLPSISNDPNDDVATNEVRHCPVYGEVILYIKLLNSFNLTMYNKTLFHDLYCFQRMNDDSDHYHGEWDQMFNDFMTNKEPNQECGSDLKELYSQISRTIDLLNS